MGIIIRASNSTFSFPFLFQEKNGGTPPPICSMSFPRPPLNHSKEYLLFPHYYNKWFDYSFSGRASIYHTRLRLGFSCLREYLFRINRCASPFCECGIDIESVKHCFSFCPRYAAQRNLLLTSAANILGDTCSSSSDAKKLDFLLYGVESVNYDINCALFREVLLFIINTDRFSMATI